MEMYHEVHMAWQMHTFEWSDSWSSIEERLKTIKSKHQYVPQPTTFKRNHKCTSCAGKSGGGGEVVTPVTLVTPETRIGSLLRRVSTVSRPCT